MVKCIERNQGMIYYIFNDNGRKMNVIVDQLFEKLKMEKRIGLLTFEIRKKSDLVSDITRDYL